MKNPEIILRKFLEILNARNGDKVLNMKNYRKIKKKMQILFFWRTSFSRIYAHACQATHTLTKYQRKKEKKVYLDVLYTIHNKHI